ncbi:hypothetical protein E2C01_006660 [Portunus trituberculatus]|uniref:Uncharacterized protein n=1 Tax=Portunus trituberculatus TaxID=210409 RepID=A0A5B7CYF1_PORTR|nr:hypothetical protein [Portunus trituberculatus]
MMPINGNTFGCGQHTLTAHCKPLQANKSLVEDLQGWGAVGLHSHMDLSLHGVGDCVATKFHIRTAMKEQ